MLATSESLESLNSISSNSSSRKRKCIPQRSLRLSEELSNDDKFIQGIVNLDVYSVYQKNPELLLKNNPDLLFKSNPNNTHGDQDLHASSVTTAAAPLISSGVIDMDDYKDTQGAPSVIWKKGGILTISPNEDKYEQLTPEELKISSTLRVLPSQYLHIKETILTQVHLGKGPFKKRDAKSWFRIDVNKTAILFDWFKALGWIPSDDEWDRK